MVTQDRFCGENPRSWPSEGNATPTIVESRINVNCTATSSASAVVRGPSGGIGIGIGIVADGPGVADVADGPGVAGSRGRLVSVIGPRSP